MRACGAPAPRQSRATDRPIGSSSVTRASWNQRALAHPRTRMSETDHIRDRARGVSDASYGPRRSGYRSRRGPTSRRPPGGWVEPIGEGELRKVRLESPGGPLRQRRRVRVQERPIGEDGHPAVVDPRADAAAAGDAIVVVDLGARTTRSTSAGDRSRSPRRRARRAPRSRRSTRRRSLSPCRRERTSRPWPGILRPGRRRCPCRSRDDRHGHRSALS